MFYELIGYKMGTLESFWSMLEFSLQTLMLEGFWGSPVWVSAVWAERENS
jgi:hypothetical protein